MATIQENKTVTPTTINKFIGLNLSNTGDTQIALGESGRMDNFYITDDYKLRKMYGYTTFSQFGTPIRGVFSAKIANKYYLLVVTDGHLYGFDGNTLNDDYEVKPQKVKTFAGDGTTTTFDLLKEDIESVDAVYQGGVEITTGYTANLENGTVTFTTAPANETSIRVEFTKHIEYTDYGEIEDANGNAIDTDASFFEFDNKVYILSGSYYVFNPEELLAADKLKKVEGYTPTVFISSSPAGGGEVYDEINMLSPKKIQKFNGDGSATTYQLAQKGINSVVYVKVGGTTYTEVPSSPSATQYTVNKTNGTVTFGSAPTSEYDNVEICWSKDDGDRDIIEGMKFGTVFGGDTDSRVFLYGNPSCQNRVYYSGTTFENDIAVPSVEYFPATAQLDIGPLNFAVTDLTRQYDRLLATTNKPEAYYLTMSLEELDVTLGSGGTAKRYVPSVKTLPLNESHGNVALGQGQLLMNYPVTFENGAIMQWKATNVRDEKNVEEIGQKIKIDLDEIGMTGIKTLDLQEYNQLWIAYDKRIWIYNYYNKTFSRLKIPVSIDNITSMNGKVYASTTSKKILKFSPDYNTYDGETIEAYWEMNFSDFEVPYLRKTMNRCWILMQPQNWSSCEVSFISNRAESTIVKHIEYKKQWFDNVDFSDFSFESSINPQPFKLKLKAKKFTNMKITLKNEEDSACTILGIIMQVESFGYSK